MNDFETKQVNALVHSYQELRNALKKEIQIEIDGEMLDHLKDNDYKLCIAKKVGSFDYNVVWQSFKNYSEVNNFSWIPEYEVFCSNIFEDSLKVKTSCLPVTIGLGEMTTLSKNYRLSPAVTGGTKTALNLKNEYGAVHPGVNQLSMGIDGKKVSTPIYVAQKEALSGNIELTPKEKVLVWFEQDIETEMMFSTARSKSTEVDLSKQNAVRLLYDADEQWNII